ncbi:MAG: helix-turn-helix domain-containing protein, partial [Blautia coccoides]
SSYQMTRSCCHALNLLLLEISREYLLAEHFGQELLPTSVQDITEWIQSHFDQPLTVRGLAEKFGYHPTYLSALIKQYTGYPLVTYINRTRISVSKNLLNSHSLTIRQISSMCGFTDEKHFMKLFRQFEGMTPTQYRKAFDQKKINTL